MFDLNTKVVCIDGKFPPAVWAAYKELPSEGHIYTVRDIVPATDYGRGETCAVLLSEVVNPTNKKGVENAFACHRFRELTDDENEEFILAQEDARQGLALAN